MDSLTADSFSRLYDSFLNSEDEEYIKIYDHFTRRDVNFLKIFLDNYLNRMLSETINNEEKYLTRVKHTILDKISIRSRPEDLRFVTEIDNEEIFKLYDYLSFENCIKNNQIDTFEKLMNILGNQKNLKVLMRNNYPLFHHPLEDLIFDNCYKDENMFDFLLKMDNLKTGNFKNFLKIKRKEIFNKILLSENLYEFELEEDDKKFLKSLSNNIGDYIFMDIYDINNDINLLIENFLLSIYSKYVYNLSDYDSKNIIELFTFMLKRNNITYSHLIHRYRNEIFSVIFIDFIKNCKKYESSIIIDLLKLSIECHLYDLYDYILLYKKEYFTNEKDLIDLFYYSMFYNSSIERDFLKLMIENKIDIKNIFLETVIRETVMEVLCADMYNTEELTESIVDNIKENEIINQMKKFL